MSSYDAPEKSCTQRFEKPVEAIGTGTIRRCFPSAVAVSRSRSS